MWTHISVQQLWLFLLWNLHMINLSLTDPCSGGEDLTAVRDVKKVFTSPNYPDKHPHDSKCMWRITAELEDDVVKIVAETSSLEKQFGAYGCTFDYVAAYDGYGQSHKRLGQWCGTTRPTYVSSGRSITVVFHSDQSYAASGFSISYISGTAEYFRESTRTENGTSMMGMVGYLVLVLALLSGAMLAIRVTLTRLQCKCLERRQNGTRSLFSRRPRASVSAENGMTTTPEVFVLPVSPPSYEECRADIGDLPPSYSSIALSQLTRNPQVVPGAVQDNEGFDETGDVESFSPPPPYEFVAGELNTGTDNTENNNNSSSGNTQPHSSNNGSL